MWKNALDVVQDFFGLTRKEARGTVVFMLICLLLLWTPFVYRRLMLPLITIEPTAAEWKKLDSIAGILEKAGRNGGGFAKRPDFEKEIRTKSQRLFRFDPNEANEGQLAELGIPGFLVKRMVRFREKGGHFYKKEQLLKIYDFPPALYQQLEPYVTLRSAENKQDDKTASRVFTKNDNSRLSSKPATFDINTADTTQLVRLRGIGSKLSVRILKFRDGLGGFYTKEQFREIFGLDSLALSELTRYARIESAVKKLDINAASAETLAAHSYIRDRRLAATIVNYRVQHGPFQSPDDLKKVKVLDDSRIEKLAPYLAF